MFTKLNCSLYTKDKLTQYESQNLVTTIKLRNADAISIFNGHFTKTKKNGSELYKPIIHIDCENSFFFNNTRGMCTILNLSIVQETKNNILTLRHPILQCKKILVM